MPNLNRRDFHRLSAAALGGLVTGSMLGCGGGSQPTPSTPETPTTPEAGEGGETPMETDDGGQTVSLLLQEPHVCRGLNTCKGLGATKDNACAGQGACATAEKHDCAGQNACKGQGGCGAKPGENACKGQGQCAVPLSEEAWKRARENFEKAMQAAGKKFGPAPAPGGQPKAEANDKPANDQPKTQPEQN